MKTITQRRYIARLSSIIYMFLLLMASANLHALTFDTGSNGADGALDFTWAQLESGNNVVVFDPSDASTFDPGNPDRVLDQDNDNVFHFTSIRIPSRVIVKLTAPKLNWAPVYWISSGDIVIEAGGAIELKGDNGHSDSSIGNGRFPALPGPGGFPGGLGASAVNAAQPGFGPGGGKTATTDRAGGGGSYATLGQRYSSNSEYGGAGDLYGSPFLLPLVGGSGGAGGGNGSAPQDTTRWGGGAGGGAILLASNTQIVLDGAVDARGGVGGVNYLQGAAGSGGAIRILTPLLKGNPYRSNRLTGWLEVEGGNSSVDGGAGRVRIETFDNQYEGRFFPDNADAIRVGGLVPSTPFLPSDSRVPGWPSVRVTTIDSVAVSAEPTGSFSVPDATVSVTTELPVVFEAKNIPTTATIKLHIYGPDFAPLEVLPSFAAGDGNQSTWQADVAFPAGVSRAYLQATWVP